jgi:hypothetical protein
MVESIPSKKEREIKKEKKNSNLHYHPGSATKQQQKNSPCLFGQDHRVKAKTRRAHNRDVILGGVHRE